ncbi:MAG: 2-dehydropantoate 2-reductase [Spirochaetes bacterium]|nr:MAG: 2-dehydropantoate 2-reductase [Spirochaetota bacterium]
MEKETSVSKKTLKVAVVGAGAMGSLYGGGIAKTGAPVILYTVNSVHVEKINKKGLIIEESSSGREEVIRIPATTNPAKIQGSDIFLFFVKSASTETAARQVKSFAGENTLAVTLQNGLGNEAILKKHFGFHKTAVGVTSHGATFLSPGKIRHAGYGPTHICMSDGNNEKLKAFVSLLNQAGFETILEDNIESLIWGKLIINVAINALTALTGLPNGRLLDFEETRELMRELVREAVTVAKAKGIELPFGNPTEKVFEVARKTALNRSSMLQDFQMGKVSEIDFINNAIVREAKELKIDVPVNRTITRLIQTFDRLR